LPVGTEENHEKPQSGQPVSGPRFEPGTSWIQSRSANHSTTTFGRMVWNKVIICHHWFPTLL
jgi:hypothetical protein